MRHTLALSLLALLSCGRADLTNSGEDATGFAGDRLGEGSAALWFTSNVGTPDLLDLFRNPDAWPRARGSLNVIKFYDAQLTATEPGQCPMCGDNILPALDSVDAFTKLDQWGVAIAVEMGVLKHHTCDPEASVQHALDVIDTVAAHGGKVRFITMDEPYAGGEQVVNGQSCHFSMQESAARTAQFLKRMHELHPEVQIGDIEPYPVYRVGQLQAWLQALADNGAPLDFFHLDVDRNHAKNVHADVPNDLRALKSAAAAHGLPFGVIFWGMEIEIGSSSTPDRAYYDSVMKWVRTTQSAIGRPDHSIFQSWARLADGRNVVPNNLPEAGGCGHLRALNDGWALLAPAPAPSPNPPPAPAPTPSGGEEAKVAHAYLGILGRAADPIGLAAYTGFLKTGHSTADLARSLFGSDEFAQNRGGLSSEQLGAELYRGILGREPDPSGLADTITEIDAGRRATRAAAMLDSGEFRSSFLSP